MDEGTATGAAPMIPAAAAPARLAPPACPRCGSPDTATIYTPEGPDYALTLCLICSRHLRSEPFPMTFARAGNHVLRLGQHKGSAVAAVAAGPGRRFLGGMLGLSCLSAKTRRAIEVYLAEPTPDKGGG